MHNPASTISMTLLNYHINMTHTVHQQMWLKLFIPTIFKIMLLTERILSQDLLKLFNLNKLCLS